MSDNAPLPNDPPDPKGESRAEPPPPLEWVDTAALDGTVPPASPLIDTKRTLRRLRLIATSDESAFVGLTDPDVVAGGAVVVFSILAAAVGGWMYALIDGTGAISMTRVVMGSVLLGTVVGVAGWLGWVLIVRWWLAKAGHDVDPLRLAAGMGFAGLPFALSLFMFLVIPAFGIGAISLAWWFMTSHRAIVAVVPAAPPGRVGKANLAGFAVFALLLSVLAYAAGAAPGPFVFAGF